MTLARPPAGDRAPAPAPAGGAAVADSARAALATARAARATALDRWLSSLLAAVPSDPAAGAPRPDGSPPEAPSPED
ncbi:Fe-S oxidoreductase, partial [Actinomadura sp. DSM 109109]|nr:Fe-S oxidoreductase [Actinomadura lepetitiana]